MKLHIFNPEHDIALAHDNPFFTAPFAGRRLRSDLGFIPALWADDGDYVLVDDVQQSVDTLDKIDSLASKVIFISLQDLRHLSKDSQLKNKLVVDPWGWDSALCHQLVKNGFNVDLLPSNEQLKSIRTMSGRRWFANTIIREMRMFADGTYEAPCSFSSVDDLQRNLCRSPHHKFVLKEPWSSSGRGVRFVSCDIDDHTVNWVSRVVRQQGHIMCEPYYDKTLDFASEFYSHKDGEVTYEGLSLFHTTGGAYTGNIVDTERHKLHILSEYVDLAEYEAAVNFLCNILSNHLKGIYVGPLGVDMMALPGKRLYPCVELNLRRTMGHVALSVKSKLPPPLIFSISYTDRYKLELHTYEP